MVDVAAGVEFDGRLEGELGADVVGGEGGGVGGEGVVEVGDVGLVVFGVVEGHDLAGDAWFKSLRDLELEVLCFFWLCTFPLE